MLRHAHSPENTDALRIGDHMRYLLQNLDGEAAGSGSEFERERIQALSIFFEVVDPMIEEGSMRKAVVEQIAADGRKPDQIRACAWMKEHICTPRHLVLPQVRDDQLLTVQLVRSLDPSGQHGMALRRVAPDDQDQIGLFDVPDRAGIPTVTDGSEQASRGGSLAVPRAVVYVVGA